MSVPSPRSLSVGDRLQALLAPFTDDVTSRTKLLTTRPQVTADGRLLLFATLESGHRLKPEFRLPKSAFYALRSPASLEAIPTDQSDGRLPCLVVESGSSTANAVVVPVLNADTVNVLLNHALLHFRAWQSGTRACYALDAAARLWGGEFTPNDAMKAPWQPAFRGIYRKDDTLALLPSIHSGREQVLRLHFSPAAAGGLQISSVA